MGKLFLDGFLSQSPSLIFSLGITLVNLNCQMHGNYDNQGKLINPYSMSNSIHFTITDIGVIYK